MSSSGKHRRVTLSYGVWSATCDWGWCEHPSVGWRFWRGISQAGWLPVCQCHLIEYVLAV